MKGEDRFSDHAMAGVAGSLEVGMIPRLVPPVPSSESKYQHDQKDGEGPELPGWIRLRSRSHFLSRSVQLEA
jgi:hypothetical protein